MTRRARTIYTQAQKTIMWDRWKKGDSLNTIGRLFETSHAAISRVFTKTVEYVLNQENGQVALLAWMNEKKYLEGSLHNYLYAP